MMPCLWKGNERKTGQNYKTRNNPWNIITGAGYKNTSEQLKKAKAL